MMSPEECHRFEARAAVLRALAHPVRLYLVEKLSDGSECCVQELADLVAFDLSTVSRHLAKLRDTGILKSDRRGNQVFYSLQVPCINGLFQCIEGVLEDRARRHQAVLGNGRD